MVMHVNVMPGWYETAKPKPLISLIFTFLVTRGKPSRKLKDNLPHNTCQIYVKPHSKSTQMTLEYHIFDEKALE